MYRIDLRFIRNLLFYRDSLEEVLTVLGVSRVWGSWLITSAGVCLTILQRPK